VTTTHQQDVVDLLLDQHQQIKNLFTQLASAQGPRKKELFQELVRLLAVHESAEEEVVHPRARKIKEAGDQEVESRLQEENEAKRQLSDLYDMGVDHPQFDSKLAELAAAVVEHATNEENEEFVHLRRSVDPKQLQRMTGALKAAEAVAPTRPHPQAGESAMANLLAGPPLAVFDRIRDAVDHWRDSRSEERD